jgi:hypothetical protein
MINDEGFVQNSELVADLILKNFPVLNEPQEAWMPIETAPRDEELLLGWWQKWPELRWEWASGLAGSTKGGWLHGNATHWQRLPSPPLSRPQRGD